MQICPFKEASVPHPLYVFKTRPAGSPNSQFISGPCAYFMDGRKKKMRAELNRIWKSMINMLFRKKRESPDLRKIKIQFQKSQNVANIGDTYLQKNDFIIK